MSPETIKVSSCCGYPLVVINESEGTMHYECNKCGLPCDGVSDCANCFPQNFTHKHANQTVPICDKHYLSQSIPIKRKTCENNRHCWVNMKNAMTDHSDCDKCCDCDISFIEATKNKSPRCPHCDDMGGMDTESHKDCEVCCGCKKIDTRNKWKCQYEDCTFSIRHTHNDYNSRGINLVKEDRPLTTDEKIVEMIKTALANHDDVRLLKISEILRVRAQFEKELSLMERL